MSHPGRIFERMSLSSELDRADSPIRRFLEETYPRTPAALKPVRPEIVAAPLLRPPDAHGPIPWSQIGMTVSCRLVYATGNAAGNQDVQLARTGAAMLTPRHAPLVEGLVAEVESITAGANPVGVLDDEAERRLIRACWGLSLYETIYRIGSAAPTPLRDLRRKATVDDVLALAADPWVEDVAAMTATAVEALVAPFGEIPIADRHPGVVPAGAGLVGGADVDLLFGRTLVEMKASVEPRIAKQWLYQLISYALLDFPDEWGITEVAFYLPRRGLLIRWELTELLAILTDPANLEMSPAEARAALAEWLRADRHQRA